MHVFYLQWDCGVCLWLGWHTPVCNAKLLVKFYSIDMLSANKSPRLLLVSLMAKKRDHLDNIHARLNWDELKFNLNWFGSASVKIISKSEHFEEECYCNWIQLNVRCKLFLERKWDKMWAIARLILISCQDPWLTRANSFFWTFYFQF